nr:MULTISPECIES: pantetheine-phosphate adenylyltransferase [Moorella]
MAIYPGTFDPVTNGHLDIIKRAANLFESVIVAVAVSTPKRTYLNLAERLELLKAATSHLANVNVKPFSGLMVNFARKEGASVIIKGLRAVSDFESEMQVALMNKKLAEDIETIFLMATTEYSFVSASIVRQVAIVGGCLEGLVPPEAAEILQRHFRRR